MDVTELYDISKLVFAAQYVIYEQEIQGIVPKHYYSLVTKSNNMFSKYVDIDSFEFIVQPIMDKTGNWLEEKRIGVAYLEQLFPYGTFLPIKANQKIYFTDGTKIQPVEDRMILLGDDSKVLQKKVKLAQDYSLYMGKVDLWDFLCIAEIGRCVINLELEDPVFLEYLTKIRGVSNGQYVVDLDTQKKYSILQENEEGLFELSGEKDYAYQLYQYEEKFDDSFIIPKMVEAYQILENTNQELIPIADYQKKKK